MFDKSLCAFSNHKINFPFFRLFQKKHRLSQILMLYYTKKSKKGIMYMITYEQIKADGAIRTYITKADESLAALGYTEHSLSLIHI